MSAPAILKGVLGDWNIGGVFQAQSGVPFDVTTTVDVAGVGPGSGAQYYNIVGDPNTGRTEFDGTRAVWFNKRRVPDPDGRAPTRPRGSATTCGSPASGICTCRCARAWRSARIEWSCGGTCSTC